MPLKPPVPGLRRIHHNAIDASKVQLSIPADDTLIVSDEVANQLLASANEFQEVERSVPAESAPAPAKKAAAKKSAAAKSKS